MKTLAIAVMVLLLLGLSFVTVTKASAGTEIKYDDGSWEDSWNISPGYKVGEMFNQSDLPYAENLLVTVEIYIASVSNDTQQLTMFFLDGHTFTDLMAPIYTPYLQVGWNYIDVSSYGLVVTNDFLIGVQWFQPDGSRTQAWVGLDLDLSQNWNHTYEYNEGHWPYPYWGPSYVYNTEYQTGAENGNWMIRAVVDPAVHDVAVNSVTPYGNWTYEGWPMNVDVTTTNLGFPENETLTLSYNNTLTAGTIGTAAVLNLAPNETRTVTFTWNTAGVEPSNHSYAITAVADISPDVDSNLTNNVLQSPTNVTVRILGDMNGDGTVDIYDAIMFSNYFGLKLGEPGWNPYADMNQNNATDIFDAIILASHFGQSVAS